MATLLNLFLKLLGNWRLTAIIMVVSIISSGYAGWKIRDLFADHAELSRLQDIIDSKQKDLENKNKIATEAAKREIALREGNRRLNDLLDAEVKNPVYTQCTIPADGVSIINSAVVQSNSGQSGAGSRKGTRTLEQLIKHDAAVLQILGECRVRHQSLVKAVSK